MAARFCVAIVLAFGCAAGAKAEACNPAIDGTYCATDMPKLRPTTRSSGSGINLPPVQGIGNDLSFNRDQPGTFGAITFGGGRACIGLMRRARCN